MPAAASSVLLGRSRVYAGDWDGNLRAWDSEGEHIWDSEAEDRVERMAGSSDADPPFICATAGAEVVSFDAADGALRWRHKLEGSSDLVACTDDGSRVIATSSVYEMEYNDFIESTCWRFDGDGELLREDSFAERPWHLLLNGSGLATMGLGRPRCGLMRQTDDDCEHLQLSEDDPILCGATIDGTTIFGHASGVVSRLGKSGSGLKTLDKGVEESVLSLACDGVVALAGGDDGVVRAVAVKGRARKSLWSQNVGAAVDECALGFKVAGESTAWVASWDGMRGSLHCLSCGDGSVHASFEGLPRIRSLTSRADRVAVGLDDGRVVLLNEVLFNRRLSSIEEIEEEGDNFDGDSSRRSSLQERLRALRN
jgi:outer membrane protein assembly factor BamB